MNTSLSLRMVIGLILSLNIAVASAQDSLQRLGLQKAIELGIANSKLLKISNEKIYTAIAKIKQTNTQLLPGVRFSSTYTRISDNITPFSVQFPGAPKPIILNPQVLNQFAENLGVTQLLYSGNRVKKTIAALDFLEKAARLDFDNDQSAVVFNIINAVYNLYKLQQSKSILYENEKLLIARITDLKNLEQDGLVLRNDVLKLELSLSQLNIQQVDNNNSIEATRYGLNILLGLPDSARYAIDSSGFFTHSLTGTYADYENMALRGRPDINAADKRLSASQLNIAVTKASYLPTVTAAANYNYLRPNQRVFPNRAQFDGTWNAGLTLAWDISSLYNNKHFITEAKSNYQQSFQQKGVLADNIKTELYTNYLAYQRAREHLRLSEQTLLQADENYRLINDRLQNNLVVAADLQDALTYLVQSQLNVLVDRAEIDLAYFRFIKSTGTLH